MRERSARHSVVLPALDAPLTRMTRPLVLGCGFASDTAGRRPRHGRPNCLASDERRAPLHSAHRHAASGSVARYVRLFVYDTNPFCLPYRRSRHASPSACTKNA